MGIVVEYARRQLARTKVDPACPILSGTTRSFAEQNGDGESTTFYLDPAPIEIPLTFDSKFEGHGNPEIWRINGKSYPDTESPRPAPRGRALSPGDEEPQCTDDHPIHLHRHTFEVKRT